MTEQPHPDDAAILAALETTFTCDMQHPDGPGKLAAPCTQPAAWIATVHDCRKVRNNETTRGTTIPICAEYLEIAKNLEYPARCPGCNAPMTSLLDVIWDLQHLKPA